MSVRILAILTLVCLCSLSSPALSRGYGDGFGIGGVLVPPGDPTILGTTRLGDSVGLEVGIGLDVVSEGDDTDTGFVVGVAMRKYWGVEDQFQPFFGGRASLVYVDEGGREDSLVGLTALLGSEYFLTRRVSLRGEVELGLYFGSIEIRTGTTLAAFMYL